MFLHCAILYSHTQSARRLNMRRSEKEYTNIWKKKGYIRGGCSGYELDGTNTVTFMKHNLITVMALGPLHAGKSGWVQGFFPDGKHPDSGSNRNSREKLRNQARRVVRSRGRLEGESRNIKCLDPQGLERRFFSPVGKALRIWLKELISPWESW